MDLKTIITDYIIENRGQGHFLPYDDYDVIDSWLVESNHNTEQLLLILSEIIPNFFLSYSKSNKPPSLKKIEKKILKKIRESKKHF